MTGITGLIAAVIDILAAASSLACRIALWVRRRRRNAALADWAQADALAVAAALAEFDATWPEPIDFNVPGEAGGVVDLNVSGERWTGFAVE